MLENVYEGLNLQNCGHKFFQQQTDQWNSTDADNEDIAMNPGHWWQSGTIWCNWFIGGDQMPITQRLRVSDGGWHTDQTWIAFPFS